MKSSGWSTHATDSIIKSGQKDNEAVSIPVSPWLSQVSADGHSTQLSQCHMHRIFRSECHCVTKSSFFSRSLASSVLYRQCHTVSWHFFSVLFYLLSQCHSRFFSSLFICVLIFPKFLSQCHLGFSFFFSVFISFYLALMKYVFNIYY